MNIFDFADRAAEMAEDQEDVWDVVVYPVGENHPERLTGFCSCRGTPELIPFGARTVSAPKVEAMICYVTRRPTPRIGLYLTLPPYQVRPHPDTLVWSGPVHGVG